jgi:electron transfer flavoprotein alpha subunit
VLTIQSGSFGLPIIEKQHEPVIDTKQYDGREKKAVFLGVRESSVDDSALREARVIVAAGRGIEEEDNLDIIREFADLFKRSAVAGSRPLCDIGWLAYNQQIGITGATVSPDLYVACGISGMFQHIIGMRESGFIVAINKDKQSPFFQIADICIVEDVTHFIPLVIKEYLEMGEKQNNR